MVDVVSPYACDGEVDNLQATAKEMIRQFRCDLYETEHNFQADTALAKLASLSILYEKNKVSAGLPVKG